MESIPDTVKDAGLITQPEYKAIVTRSTEPFDPLQFALSNNAGIDVVERLVALQNQQRDRQDRVDFDEALSRCQSRVSRISADANNSQTKSKYATYAKIDKVIRPIYTEEGFSVSFGERDCPYPGKTRFVAFLSRSGVTREYLKDMTPSTKGPQGKDFMTPIHADATADSYAKRYLLKDIFNIAIGEEDTDGNDDGQVDKEWLTQQLEEISRCETVPGIEAAFKPAAKAALDIQDMNAYRELRKAMKARRQQLEAPLANNRC